jgi:hypothetical protein
MQAPESTELSVPEGFGRVDSFSAAYEVNLTAMSSMD